MNDLQILLIEELYFPASATQVAEAVDLGEETVLSELMAMLTQGFIKVEDSESQDGNITLETKLVATKKGLMALNS